MNYTLLIRVQPGVNPIRQYVAVNEKFDSSILPQCCESSTFDFIGVCDERDLIAKLLQDVGASRVMCKLTVIDSRETFLSCLGLPPAGPCE